MRRTPIVIAATAAGLFGVLSFHTKSASLTLPGLPGASSRGSSSTSVAAGRPPGPTGSGAPATSGSSTTSTTSPSTTSSSSRRSANGPSVNYNYGILSVSVEVSGKKITKVGIASLDDGGNVRSQSIDQQSIPILEQQALQAQSANIQGVSGASYTSAGFEQSLQSALSKLGLA
jgi:uncharacterized protein with FMN-binding domain